MIGLVVTIALITYLGIRSYKNAFKRPVKNFPPGPPSLPIYGAYWIVLFRELNNLGGSMKKLAQDYKTKVLGMYLGAFPVVVIEDSQLIKEALNNPDFDGRVDFFVARLRSFWKKLGIFFTDGYFWHIQRRFSLRYMRDFGFGRRSESLEAVISNDINELKDMIINGTTSKAEKKIVNGNLIYLQNFFAVPLINGMMHVLFKTSLPRSEYPTLWKMAETSLMFQRGTNDLGGSLSLTPWLKNILPNYCGYKGLQKGNQAVLNFLSKYIDEAKRTQVDTHDRHFVDTYIRNMKEELKKGDRTTFSDDQLKMICIDYMFPSSSGVPSMLTMLFERLLIQPEIQDKIHEEIDRVVGRGRLPTLDDRKDLPYTEATIREMMRIETLVPLGVPHRTVQDTKIGGYDVPENTMVSFNFQSFHNDKEIWGDPENFRPERFIVNGKLDLSKDKSLPFGAGKRLCAGETFARHGMFLIVTGLLQTFRISTADGKPRKMAKRIQGFVTTIPEFWMKVTPRD